MTKDIIFNVVLCLYLFHIRIYVKLITSSGTKNKKMEKEAVLKNHRLSTLQSIYDQMPQFPDLHTNKSCQNDIENINFLMNTRRYILRTLY